MSTFGAFKSSLLGEFIRTRCGARGTPCQISVQNPYAYSGNGAGIGVQDITMSPQTIGPPAFYTPAPCDAPFGVVIGLPN